MTVYPTANSIESGVAATMRHTDPTGRDCIGTASADTRVRKATIAAQLSRFADGLPLFGSVVGLLVLFGYAIDYSPAWRLAADMPAIHPSTALCFVLLGVGFFAGRGERGVIRTAARAAVCAVAFFAMLRILPPSIGASLFYDLTPFKGVLVAQAAAGHPIGMGINGAHVLLLIAAAEMVRWKRWDAASQLLACGAIMVLFMAFTGFLYGITKFYGTMAIPSVTGALLLASSVLRATRDHGVIRPLIAAAEPGRVARLLLSSSTLLILSVGWLTTHYTRTAGMTVEADALPAYQSAAVIILSWVLVIAATVRSDLIDQRHRSAEASLLHAATTDALTGLLVRNQMEQYRCADHARSAANTAEFSIDLDRFRMVNYTFGTTIANEFLVEIGQRLLSVSGSHPIGRMGGDEFSIICSGVSLEEAMQLGSVITAVLAIPFVKRGRTFHLTASVGVGHSATAGEINLRRASHTAMRIAKRRGGNQAVVFEAAMFEDQRSHAELEQYLYDALEQDDELTLAFQPVVDVSSQRVVAVEALARWTHPELGSIPPSRFIEVAEKSGLVVPLGQKLMGMAVAQAALWRDRYADRAPRINLNISPTQLGTGDIIGDLKRRLDRHGLPTTSICIEVTEGVFSDAHAASALQRACDLGFTVSMDDFGIGYSSLSQLPRLPITTVKLDRSFIVDATETECGARLLASIAHLARGLSLKIVAEGVETSAQLALVDQVGCDAVQGYFYARPMTPEQFQDWFAGRALLEAEA